MWHPGIRYTQMSLDILEQTDSPGKARSIFRKDSSSKQPSAQNHRSLITDIASELCCSSCSGKSRLTKNHLRILIMPFFLPSGPQWASHHWMSSVLCLSEIPEWLPVQFWCWLDLCSKRNAPFRVPHPTTDPCHSDSRPAHSASSSASLPHSDPNRRPAGWQWEHQLKQNRLHSWAGIASLLTSSAGVIFSSRRLSRLSMANMRLFSSFICQEKNRDTLNRRHRPAAAAVKCFLPYRRGLTQVLLGRCSAVSTAMWHLLTHGGVPGVIVLIRGVDILLPRHRRADLWQRASVNHPVITVVIWPSRQTTGGCTQVDNTADEWTHVDKHNRWMRTGG